MLTHSLPSYQRLFGYDPSLLRPNTEESFRISPGRLCSHWLLDADARLTPCAHYPSPELLGAVANNPKEQRARQRVLAQHPNKFAGYAAFAKAYVQALRSGQSLDTIAPATPEFELIRPVSELTQPIPTNGHQPQSATPRRSS